MEKFLNQIICGDCNELLKSCPENFFDLVIADPPYGINYDIDAYKMGGKSHTPLGGTSSFKRTEFRKTNWDGKIPEKSFFEKIRYVGKNQVIWGGNYFVEHLTNSRCWIVWDKETNGNFADCELAWTSYKTSVRIFRWRWNGAMQQYPKYKETRIHPTQKPLGLYKWLIEKYTKPGDKILDPMSGSGTTAVACQALGRDFVCIEMDNEYVKDSKKRLSSCKIKQAIRKNKLNKIGGSGAKKNDCPA